MSAATKAPMRAASRLGDGWRAHKKLWIMMLLGLVVGVEFLENGMFVFAASHIVGGVDAAPREFAQVQAAYAIGSMLMIVMQQSLSRHFGYRRYLTASLALFAAGAVACACAQGLTGLTVSRLVQGFGGGALFTSSRVLIPMMFAPAERPLAVRWFMLVLFALSACAPGLSATVVDAWGWRWVFLAVLPLAIVALVGSWALLPDALGRGGRPVRWAAGPLVLVAIALTLLQLALSEARYDMFSHPLHLAVIAAAGAGLLLYFLFHQWHHDEPFMRLRELKHPVYVMGLALYSLHYLLSNAASYIFPIYAERALGYPLETAGWLNTLSAGISLAGAYAYVKLGGRIRRKKILMATGALLLAFSAFELASMPPDAPPSALAAALVAKGLFGVLLVLPVAGLTFRDLGDERFAHGYQSKNLMRQIAGSFSTAVTAVLLENRQYANTVQLQGLLSPARPEVSGWMDSVQASFAALGMAPGQAHAAALAELSRIVDRQAQLLACEDLYRMLAVAAAFVAVIVLAQRRLK